MRIGRLVLVALLVAGTSTAQGLAPEAVTSGFQALRQGDGDRAASIFREALGRYPRDPWLLLGAGVAATQLGQTDEAIVVLKRALEIEPKLGEAALVLGELYYRQGDLDPAIKMYERALQSVPPTAAGAMRPRLDAWREEAALPQNREAIKDDRFTIRFDGPVQEQLATRATSVLSAAFWRIGKTLGSYPSASINVVLYSRRQFRDITGAPEWSGGGFDGQIRLPVAGAAQNLAEFDRVLTHELAHAMLTSIAPRNLPVWLHEGIAMYCEGHDVAQSGRRLAQARIFVPLAALQTSFLGLNADQALVAYQESAFATRALIDRIGPSGLSQLLQDLGAGQTVEQAIEQFGITFAAFEADLARRVGAKDRPAGR